MQEFFQNVSRYPRYLISFTLGIFLNAISPFLPLFKRPIPAIMTISVLVAAFAFITFTLRAMLGLDVG
jgi:heme/copper-type cytochrome/quinol oxidase subunit 4